MQNKKLMVIPMLLIVALVITGFAYAHWSKTLTIIGTVNTGELDWQITDVSCLDTTGYDYHCRDDFAGPAPRFWMGDKDVGNTSCGITDSHTVTVNLTNVYPSYYTSVSVYAHNTGTIPLIIEKVVIDTTEITAYPYPIVKLDLNGDLKNDIEIWWRDGIGTQMHPCEDSPEMSFWIHVLQDAPQGETLSFTIKIVAIQWNEYVSP